MRFLDLRLLAFGSFEDRRIDLSAGDQGLHLIFGLNESGKSTALRAVRGLLYGIHPQSPDAYRYKGRKMALGARLGHSDGSELAILRRKQTKNSLMDLQSEEPLPESALQPYLGGHNSDDFIRIFGMDHQELVLGGEAILEQKGEVGQSLFAAALGTAGVRKLQEGLDNEARQLFLPTGQKPTVNRLLKELVALNKQRKEALLRPSEYADRAEEVRLAEERQREVAAELSSARVERARARRLLKALPWLDKRSDLQEKIKETDGLPRLDVDFSSRRQQAEHTVETTGRSLQRLDATLEERRVDLDNHRPATPLLEAEETIEKLYRASDSRAEAVAKQSIRRGTCEQLRKEATALLAELSQGTTLEQAERWRPALGMRAQVRRLAEKDQELQGIERTLRAQQLDNGQKLEELARQSRQEREVRDSEPLRRAVEQAGRRGALDATVAKSQREAQVYADELNDRVARLGLWQGSVEELARLALPTAQTCERFEREFDRLREEELAASARREEAEEELRGVERELEAIRLSGGAVTEAELERARTVRDELWAVIRDHGLQGDEVERELRELGARGSPPAAFEKAMARADALADRLRREAERVHQQAKQLAYRQALRAKVDDLDGARERREQALCQLTARWEQTWAEASITPRRPAEMRAWLGVRDEISRDISKLREKLGLVEQAEEQRERLREGLCDALAALGSQPPWEGPQLEPLLGRAEKRLKQLESEQSQSQKLSERAEELELARDRLDRQQQQCDDGRQTWQRQWQTVVPVLGLAVEQTPAEAGERIDALKELFSLLKQVDTIEAEIRVVDEQAKDFARRVKELAGRIAPELLDSPSQVVVAKLHAALKQARATQQKRQAVQRDIDRRKEERKRYTDDLQDAENTLKFLRRQAGCERTDQLAEVEARWQERQAWERKHAELETVLLDIAEGATLAQLLAEAERADPEQLAERVAELDGRVAELEREAERSVAEAASLTTSLKQMDGAGLAADLAAQAQEIVSELRLHVEEYTRLRVATVVLSREVERYRSRHQGALLSRGAELFSRLTLGSFTGLDVDYDKKDQPMLVGCRPGGEKLKVDAMSEGTRDQLYLALRLAALEELVQKSEPLPLVADDILVNFDDQRSRVTLEILAQLSKKTQVLLFTHHRSVVELAEGLNHPEVFVHPLQDS